MNCTYRGTNANRVIGSYWNIKYSRSTSSTAVSGINFLSGFNVSSTTVDYTSLTINKVSENVNASELQCFFTFPTSPAKAGSGKIKVILGSMKNMLILSCFNSCLTVGLPIISCKPHLCTSVRHSNAEIPCEASGTPIPSTKIDNWLKLNSDGTSFHVDSS